MVTNQVDKLRDFARGAAPRRNVRSSLIPRAPLTADDGCGREKHGGSRAAGKRCRQILLQGGCSLAREVIRKV